jgi:hypothetical protein
MQFDHLDKKFREAAEHHHPPYDEHAWANMEKLLDKHMPVEEKKRRFLFFFLLFALLGVSGLLIMQPWKSKKAGTVLTEKKAQPVPAPTNTQLNVAAEHPNNVTSTSGITDGEKRNLNENFNAPVVLTTGPANHQSGMFPKTRPAVNGIFSSRPVDPASSNKVFTNQPVIDNPVMDKRADEKPADMNLAIETISSERVINNAEKSKIEKNTITTVPVMTSPKEEGEKNQPVAKAENTRNSKKKTHSFFISLGGGPDLSYTGIGERGSIKLFGGAGLGYTYNNRLSLRAGFYSGRKIYTADPYDYNAPAIFYTYYPNLQKVDANCKVYEVPIAISYIFNRNNKRQFFASAGVSSYFMKKETYNYYYKYTPTGPTVSKSRSIYNGSNHYFAGLTLSGGYTRKLTNRISLTIEPYTKLPLQGIGYGKVKLNSSGILFSLGIQPFQKNH